MNPKFSFKHEILTMDGFSPAYKKENQDYSCCHSFTSNKETTRIYVLADGHGPNGQHASKNASEKIISLLQDWISATKEAELTEEKVKEYLSKSFLEAHEDLHRTESEPNMYKHSGTTMVVAVIRKNTFFLANLGDSRGFLATQIGSKVVPSLISKDHKPEDPEEMKRIVDNGGFVCPFKEEDGSHSGPPRVWNKYYTEPGLATSRSIGDFLAHRLGVSTAPGSLD